MRVLCLYWLKCVRTRTNPVYVMLISVGVSWSNNDFGQFICRSRWFQPNDICRSLTLSHSHPSIAFHLHHQCVTSYSMFVSVFRSVVVSIPGCHLLLKLCSQFNSARHSDISLKWSITVHVTRFDKRMTECYDCSMDHVRYVSTLNLPMCVCVCSRSFFAHSLQQQQKLGTLT